MKNRMRTVKNAVASKTIKDTVVGAGLFGLGEIAGACALGCLVIWLVLATLIMLVWALVAFLASVLPL